MYVYKYKIITKRFNDFPKMGLIGTENVLETNCVQTVLSNYLLGENFSLKSFELLSAGNQLLGFMGDHLKLKVKYELNGKNQETMFFVKSSPKNNKYKSDFMVAHGVFNREITIYSEIMSKFGDVNDSQMWHPRCLFTSSDMLIFEDLSLKGFQMLELNETQNEEHCFVGLTSLARFHGAAIIFEENMSLKNSQKYRISDSFQKKLSGSVMEDNSFSKVSSGIALRLAEESENYGKNTPYFESVRKNWHNLFKRGMKLLDFSEERRNVINHSDLWNNNIMFQHDDSGKPKQCIFVDYQACIFLPPCADVMSYLYMNLGRDLRSASMDKFLNYYYTTLTEELKDKNIRIEDIFPKKQFDECCEKYKLWGLVHSLIIFQFVFIEGEVATEMINDSDQFESLLSEHRGDIIMKAIRNNPITRERVLSNTDDLIESYIVKKAL